MFVLLLQRCNLRPKGPGCTRARKSPLFLGCLVALCVKKSWRCEAFTLSPKRTFSGRPNCCQRRPFATSDQNNDGQSDFIKEVGWEVGNVYDDFDRLEQAIAIADADIYYKEMETKEELDAFAKQRRPLVRDMFRFVLVPIALASTMVALPRTAQGTRPILVRSFVKLMDLQFWSAVVASPILMLRAKKKSLPTMGPLPPALQKWEDLGMLEMFTPTELVAEYGWDDPKTSCRDHALCLLEQWKSCVAGAAIVGCLQVLLRTALPVKSRVFLISMAMSQLLNRLGAVAALYQYRELLFQLERSKQPRPMDRFQVILGKRVKFMIGLFPLGVTADLTKILGLVKSANTLVVSTATTRFPQSAATTLLNVAMIGSFVGPLCHLIAVNRVCSAPYKHHDLSHALPDDEMHAILSDPIEKKRRCIWRYSLDWRDPERISQTLARASTAFMDWIFYEGSVDQKLKIISHGEIKTALDWIAEDKERGSYLCRPNASDRKIQAMKRLAVKHENDYEIGKFSDPLGVAVWKVFGIGLNYDFDHWSDLEEEEEPSIYRLRARAAKSAIRRTQMIYDSQAAQAELSAIGSMQERKRKSAAMQDEAELEIKFLADELVRLIPFNPGTDSRIDYDVKIIEKLPPAMRKGMTEPKFTKVSENEYVIEDESPTYDATVVSLLERYGPGSNPSGSSPQYNEDGGTEKDDAFVDEWLKRQDSGANKDYNDKDEDGMESVLV